MSSSFRNRQQNQVYRRQQREIVVFEWQNCGEHFLRDISLSSPRNELQIHVFFEKSQMKKNMNSVSTSLTKNCTFHESLTTGEDAAWTDVIAFLVNFYTKQTVSCSSCITRAPKPMYRVTLVSRDKEKYKELKALLRANKTGTLMLDGRKNSLLDVFPHVCVQCKIIFKDKNEAAIHDKKCHNFLCANKTCERSQRANGFFTERELLHHKRRQKQCQFCTDKLFCNVAKYNDHMKHRHILCKCPCRCYYRNIDEFVEHYITVYPLPCLENTECKTRFKNIDHQAFHHKTVHGSAYPYYCFACYGRRTLVCLRTTKELMKHVRDAGHTEESFEIIIMSENHISRVK